MRKVRSSVCCMLLALGTVAGCTSPAPDSAAAPSGQDLRGTSWQLVTIHGGGAAFDRTSASHYTIAFGTDNRVSVRILCNRGAGTWQNDPPHGLSFGPLGVTRAYCPDPIGDRLINDWPSIRAYAFKQGHLYLSHQPDSEESYEFERVP